MVRTVAALGFLAALAPGASSAAGDGASPEVEVERVVAVIRSPGAPEVHVITRTRLEAETRVALVSRGAPLAASGRLDGPALQAGLDWLVDQTLLVDEATRLQIRDLDRADVAADVTRFQAALGGPAAYRSFLDACDFTEEELEAILRRTLRVKRYVESRVAYAGQVSEAEVTAWLDSHAAELGARDRDLARAQLTQARVRDEVKALVRDLRGRAEVRLLADPAAWGKG